jgi:hypothetical protein
MVLTYALPRTWTSRFAYLCRPPIRSLREQASRCRSAGMSKVRRRYYAGAALIRVSPCSSAR